MVGAWFFIILGLASVIGGIVALVKAPTGYSRTGYIISGIVAIILGLALAAGSAFWLYGTEAGARALKSWQSQTGGGLTRVVTVYDMEGDILEQHEGKFDVDANEQRIIFDVPQPDGSYKRVQIWSSTGTVSIKEL